MTGAHILLVVLSTLVRSTASPISGVKDNFLAKCQSHAKHEKTKSSNNGDDNYDFITTTTIISAIAAIIIIIIVLLFIPVWLKQ